MLFTDDDADEIVIYDDNLTEIARTALTLGSLPSVSSDRLDKFYVFDVSTAGKVTRVLLDGTIDDTWNVTTNSKILTGATPSRDNTKLYYHTSASTLTRMKSLQPGPARHAVTTIIVR